MLAAPVVLVRNHVALPQEVDREAEEFCTSVVAVLPTVLAVDTEVVSSSL